jgi:hypothetical protein
LFLGRDLPRATVGILKRDRHERLASALERARGDGRANRGVFLFDRLEDAAGVAKERVVTNRPDRVADEWVDHRVLCDTGIQRGEAGDIVTEIACRRGWIGALEGDRSIHVEDGSTAVASGGGRRRLGWDLPVSFEGGFVTRSAAEQDGDA